MEQQQLLNRVKQSLPGERLKVVQRHGGRKISEIVTEFAEPWLNEARNDDQRRVVIGMAVLAWNMAGYPEPERWAGMSSEFAEMLDERAEAILKDMIARKLALYSEDTRPILDYDILGGGEKMRLNVAYPLLPKEIRELEHGNDQVAG